MNPLYHYETLLERDQPRSEQVDGRLQVALMDRLGNGVYISRPAHDGGAPYAVPGPLNGGAILAAPRQNATLIWNLLLRRDITN
jgi:hypothetical protein